VARKIEVEVVGNTKSIEAAFKRTSKAGRSLEKDLLAVGKRAALAVGALGVAAGAASFKLVKMAGDAEEVRSKFKVTFQQEMPRMVRQLDAFSKATGASRFELRQQAADLGALLVPLVGSRRAAGDLSVGFTKLATDLSSFNNVPVGDALTAIRAGLVGEAEPLRRFGVLLNEAAVKAEAYRSGIAKSGAALTEQQKVQARANLIMAQTKLAQGDATRTADSFTNQMRKLQNQVRDTATELGLKLLPIATTVLNKLNEWGPAIANKVQPHLDALGAWADEHRDEFRQMFTNITEGAKNAGVQLRAMAGGADRVASVMGGWDQAFSLILSGVLANKFLKVGKSLTGAGGMLPVLTKLKGLGPTIAIAVVIDLAINEAHRKQLAGWAKLLADKVGLDDPRWIPVLGIFSGGKTPTGSPATTTPQGTVADPRGGGVGAAGTGRGSVTVQPRRLPTGQGAQPIKAHVIEFVKRLSAAYGSPLTIWDNSTHNRFVSGSQNESQHWTGNAADIPMSGQALTRLGQTALIVAGASPSVAYKQTGGAFTVNGVNILFNTNIGGNHFDHLHVGLTSLPAGTSAARGNKKVSGATGGGAPPAVGAGAAAGGGGGVGGAGGAKATELVPAGLRLALAKAEGTKNIGDDLTALRAMVAYLQKLLPKTKDIEKRIEITEALNGLRSRISELGKDGKKKVDILSPADYEAMKAKLRDAFRDGIKQAQDKVRDARAGFTAAFGILSDSLLQVFDAKTAKMLDNLRVQVAGFGFETAAGEETPSERLIRERSEQRTDQALANARANAKTTEEIAAADEALADRQLEKMARAERAAADKALADEARRLQEERALQRDAFTKSLADLQEKWNRTNATTAQRTKELTDLMAKFGLPFNEVGALLGTSFATGFLDSMQIVFDRLADLARELNKITPAQAAEAVILAGGTALAARSAALNAKYGLGSLPQFQKGGIVPGSGPQLAIVHGGETITPRGAGTGGVVVNVYGDVTGTQLVETVRREINRIQKQNGRAGTV
jgi:hypothetical protein